MSAAALATQAPLTETKPGRPRLAKVYPGPARDFRDTETASLDEFIREREAESLGAALTRLVEAAQRAPDRPLPKRDRLEALFGHSLAHFSAVWSSEIRHCLQALRAKAAVLGDTMILPEEGVSFETLAHETAHLLQSVSALRRANETDSGEHPVDGDEADEGHAEAVDDAEAEADVVAHDVSGQASPEGPSAPELACVRPRDTVLFQALAEAEDAPDDWERSQDYRAAMRATDAEPPTPPPPAANETRDSANDNTQAQQSSPSDGPGAADEAQSTGSSPSLELGEAEPLPQPELGAGAPDMSEEVAQAEQAIAESEAALDAATTPEDYAEAFRTAAPSVKADRESGYAARLDALASGEAEAFNATLPEPAARMSGEEDSATEVDDIQSPQQQVDALEAADPSPAPEPEVAPTAEAEPFTINDAIARLFGQSREETSPEEVARSIGSVSTRDDEVDTSAGPAPSVPLEGETDPERMSEQSGEAQVQADERRDEAMSAVVEGPGPEQVQLQELDEAIPLTIEAASFASPELQAGGGTDEFQALELDPESQAIFDQAHAESMEAGLADAQAQTDSMVQERESRREDSVAQAEADIAAAESEADSEQRSSVVAAREQIQADRQQTLDAQAAAVEELDADVASEGERVRGEIDTRIEEDEASIADDFAEAETEAEAEVAQGEADAESEREEADREAENQSWWDRAVGWVKEQLSALTEAIGAIFDAVREAVSVILDAVKDAALALIDAAADFVKGAITLYGEFLKAGVNLLVGSVFPELAEELNAMIDQGVQLAHQAVDAVADRLKAAVTAIVDTLNAAINAILDFVQGALETIVAVVSAVLSGDWAEVARLVLEPILRTLGVNPDDFYTYIGNVMQTIGNIVAHPIDFLSNLFGAIFGGFELFGENFVDHLISGIVGWLTGAFAGDIEMPEQFDFWGILDIARQIMGLTLDMMRRVAVRILGEEAVERIEFFLDYAMELINGGWSAFFERIQEDLSGLFDMVMGQITSFLMERLIRAGITWLASLINPAGALLKIIMMIWDFIMWLKDNFMRMVQIVQTIVDGMIDIANGNLDPAKQAVEATLGRLLPPAIDLIARLIGLGNVANRVQDIIGGIRQRIEDAIVNLIRRVLARFTGRGRGGGAADDDASEGADGALMQPLAFSGGGESHTLYMEERGSDVVPMMRSTPTAVEDWLNSLKTDAGVRRQLQAGSTDDAEITDALVTEKKTAIADDVTAALTKEDQLDEEGEQADDARDAGDADAAAETQDVADAARQLKTPLENILEALGLSAGGEFKDRFVTEIAATRPAVKTSLEGVINQRINEDSSRNVVYGQLDWQGVKAHLGSDLDVLTNAIKKPLHSGGVLAEDETFLAALYEHAADLSRQSDALPDVTADDLRDSSTFKSRALLPNIQDQSSTVALVGYLLEPANASPSATLTSLSPAIETALEAFAAQASTEEDKDYKDKVKAAAFRPEGLFSKRETFQSGFTMKYYPDLEQEGDAEDRPLIFFLSKSGGSQRAQKNISYTADMVRAADPGQHEWILSSTANQAIQATINSLQQTGDTDEVEGFANFVQFQHEVRTPTNRLLFSPEYVSDIGRDRNVHIITQSEITKLQGGTPLTDEEVESVRAKVVPAIQAHAGGLNMVQLTADNSAVNEAVASQSASPRWHSDLQTETSDALVAVGSMDLADMNALGTAIKSFFDSTIFGPSSPLKNTGLHGGFGEYRFSAGGGSTHTYAEIVDEAHERFAAAKSDLEEKIRNVMRN